MSNLLLKYFYKRSNVKTSPENLITLARKPHVQLHFELQCDDYNSKPKHLESF